SRSSVSSTALYTVPMPPRPRRDTTRYFPTVWPTMASSALSWGTKILTDPPPFPCANVRAGMAVLLTERDVRAVLSMDDLIPAMETALDRFSAGAARQPLRTVVEAGAHGAHGFYG